MLSSRTGVVQRIRENFSEKLTRKFTTNLSGSEDNPTIIVLILLIFNKVTSVQTSSQEQTEESLVLLKCLCLQTTVSKPVIKEKAGTS